jgi:hypothetical protein
MMRVRDEAWAMVTDAWPLHRLKSTLEDLSLPPWLPGTKHITTVVTLVQNAPHYLFSTVSSDSVDTALSVEGGEEKECSDVQSPLGGWVQLDTASYSHARTLLSLLVLLVATVILYRRRFPPKIHGLPCIPDDRYHRHIYIHTHFHPLSLTHTSAPGSTCKIDNHCPSWSYTVLHGSWLFGYTAPFWPTAGRVEHERLLREAVTRGPASQFSFLGLRFVLLSEPQAAKAVLRDVTGKGLPIHRQLDNSLAQKNTFNLDTGREWAQRRSHFRAPFR